MKQLELNDPNEVIVVNDHYSKKLFRIESSELIDALYLWKNTQKEMQEDIEQALLPNEQGKIRALFYNSIEGGKWKRLKHPIYKEGFKSGSFVSIPHAEYSEAFGYEIQNEVLLVGETIPVYGLTFSDGSRYYHGKQKAFDDRVISQAELISLGKQIDNQA